MDGYTIGLLIGAGVIIAFTMGFLFGIGYQSAEDRRTFRMSMNKIKKDYEDMSKQNFDEAYALGKKHQKQETDQEWEMLMRNPMAQMPWNDIKFGDES